MPQDPKRQALGRLAKYGHFDELCRTAATIDTLELSYIFDRAVTDFRTIKRNPGHQKILQWCLQNGLELNARAGWLNQPVVCLAAQYGNNEIIEFMSRGGLPNNPFIRASVGDRAFLQAYGSRH